LRSRAAIFAICWIFLLAIVRPTHGQSPSSPKPAAAKPADLPLIDLDGYNKILSTYKGKPLLVSFWATWCEPCRYEYPTIVELAKKYAPEGLAVFGVSFDSNADMHLVRDFLAKNKPGFPNYRQRTDIDVDAFNTGVNPQWNGTMPETIFYGRDGKILFHFEGGHSQSDFEKAIQMTLAAR
jgi:thiol-disulfide isomerase/thioredoxin